LTIILCLSVILRVECGDSSSESDKDKQRRQEGGLIAKYASAQPSDEDKEEDDEDKG